MHLEQALPQSDSRIRPLRAALVCLVACGMSAVIPFVEYAYLYVLVGLMALCVAGPVWHDWYRGRLDYFAPIHVVGTLYFVFFGLGALWVVHDPNTAIYGTDIVPYVPQATLYCLLGYMALLAGYYLPWRGRALTAPLIDERPSGSVFILATGLAGIAGFGADVVWQRSRIFGLNIEGVVGSMAQLAPLFLFSWMLTWLLFFSRQSTVRQRLVLFGVFVPAACMIAYYTFSNKTVVTTLGGLPIIAMWYGRRKIRWTWIIALFLVLIFVIFPYYNTFRNFKSGLPQRERMAMTYRKVNTWGAHRYLQTSMDSFKDRMALITSVAVVIRDVGRWVPYAKGETLLGPVVTFFIPRVLWPDKPVFEPGKEFGKKFRVVPDFNRETHIDPTVPGELYWNFDLPGILVGMGLWGALMRLLYRRYGEFAGGGPVRRAIHVLMVYYFATVGGSLAGLIAGLPRTLAMLEVLRWLGRRSGLLEPFSAAGPSGSEGVSAKGVKT